MFCDKTLHSIQMSKAITYYLRFIDELYQMIEYRFDFEKEKKEDKEKFEKIRAKYKTLWGGDTAFYIKYKSLEDMLKIIIYSSQSMLETIPMLYHIIHND